MGHKWASVEETTSERCHTVLECACEGNRKCQSHERDMMERNCNQEMLFRARGHLPKKNWKHIAKSRNNTGSSMHKYAVMVLDMTPNVRFGLAQHVSMVVNPMRTEQGRNFRAGFIEDKFDSKFH